MFECESWTDELGQFRPGKLCARENEVEPENGANIRLIRVAPELLEALEALLESAKSANASLNWATGLNDEPASFDQARTAIRKARGE